MVIVMNVENVIQSTHNWDKIYGARLSANLKQDFIELFEDLFEKQGSGRINGRILATIFLKEVPMTQGELERQTGFSRSTINKAVNSLQKSGFIRKRKYGEGKTLVYSTDLGPEEIILSGVKDYMMYFTQIYERFSKVFERDLKLEGLPSKQLKEFIEHLPKVNDVLRNALAEISRIELVLKK